MMHPDTEIRLVSPQVGVGVFATKFIPKGTITWVWDPADLYISEVNVGLDHPLLTRELADLSTMESEGGPFNSQDIGDYMNHCCQGNTVTTGWSFDIAVRDIGSGEEIRVDYGVTRRDFEMALNCKSAVCRKSVKADDFEVYADHWDEIARDALACARAVTQPLLDALDEQPRLELKMYSETGKGYRSVRDQIRPWGQGSGVVD